MVESLLYAAVKVLIGCWALFAIIFMVDMVFYLFSNRSKLFGEQWENVYGLATKYLSGITVIFFLLVFVGCVVKLLFNF